MKANRMAVVYMLGVILGLAACKPSSDNNVTPPGNGNVLPPGNGNNFQVSAPASIDIPVADLYFGSVTGDTTRIDAVMTVTNPNAADTVHYTILESGNNLYFAEVYDSTARDAVAGGPGPWPITGFGVGSFTRRLQFKHQYPNHADTTERVKVAFWNAQHSDTVTIFVHTKKAKGYIHFSGHGYDQIAIAAKQNYLSPDNFYSDYSYATYDFPVWDNTHSGFGGSGGHGEAFGGSFYPPLSSTPNVYQASRYEHINTGGIPKCSFSGGGSIFMGTDLITTDSSAGQVKAWMGPQGPIMEILQPVQLYATPASFNPGAMITTLKEVVFYY